MKYGITSEEMQKINEFFDYLNNQGWGYLYTDAAKKIILKGVMPVPENDVSPFPDDLDDELTGELILAG